MRRTKCPTVESKQDLVSSILIIYQLEKVPYNNLRRFGVKNIPKTNIYYQKAGV